MDKTDSTTFESHSSSRSDSTKTDSSGGQSADVKKEEDFTKDNAASPIDLECHIQAERITKVLDQALEKTKLALCLPELIRQYRSLGTSLSSQHLDDILFIFEQYENPLFSSSLLNMSAMEDIQAGDVSLKNRLNPELGHMIYILNSYPALKPKINELVEKMKTELLEQPNKEPPPGLFYLLELEHLRDQMVVQMDTTAADELRAKFRTRKLEESNKELLDQIMQCSMTLKEENDAFEIQMQQKQETIKNLEMEFQLYEHQADLKLKKKILDSDRQMVVASRTHVVKYDMLQEEKVETTTSYDNLLKNDLLTEKNQRARRNKVETQLMSWLQKYDVEMREKQNDLDLLNEQYEEEFELHSKLEIDLEEQNKEYEPLMKEREEEYHTELTEKMKLFLVEHAARVIQVAWRDTLANRAEKKKLKKLLKKKQAAEEAAERAAELAARKAAAAARRAAAAAKKEADAEKKAAKAAAKLAAQEANKEANK